jgi:hypothetical protein
VEVDPARARRPGVGGWGEMSGNAAQYWRGAPSWSWASVDGPVHWVRDRHGPVHIGPYALLTKPSGAEAYNGLEWGAIRVRGPLLEAQQLSWIREESKKPRNPIRIREMVGSRTRFKSAAAGSGRPSMGEQTGGCGYEWTAVLPSRVLHSMNSNPRRGTEE